MVGGATSGGGGFSGEAGRGAVADFQGVVAGEASQASQLHVAGDGERARRRGVQLMQVRDQALNPLDQPGQFFAGVDEETAADLETVLGGLSAGAASPVR